MSSCFGKDRDARRIEEWKRRNQKLACRDDAVSASSATLFSAPYKTNGDEISSRLESTLGSYDEMKDIIIHQSNQSHLVGVAKPAGGSGQSGGGSADTATIVGVEKTRPGVSATSDSCGGAQPASRGNLGSASASGSGRLQQQRRGTHGHPETQHNGTRPATIDPESTTTSLSSSSAASSSSSSAASSSAAAGPRDGHSRPPRSDTAGNKAAQAAPKPTVSSSSSASSSSTEGGTNPGASKGLGRTSGDSRARHAPRSSSERCKSGTSGADPGTAGETAPGSDGGDAASGDPSAAILPSKPQLVPQKPTAYVRPMDGLEQALVTSELSRPELKGGPSGSCTENSVCEEVEGGRSKLCKILIPQPQPVEDRVPLRCRKVAVGR